MKVTPEVTLVFSDGDGEVARMSHTLGRALCLIDRYGSMNRAAKELSMSCTGTFCAIRRFEERTGMVLVETDTPRRGTKLTDYGRHLAHLHRSATMKAAS